MTPTRVSARAWPIGAGLAMAVGSVVLAVLSANASYGLTRERESTCDGAIPMPASAFVLGWSAVVVAALAVLLVIAARPGTGRRPVDVADRAPAGWLRLGALGCAVLATVFAAYVVFTVYQDAPLERFICSG